MSRRQALATRGAVGVMLPGVPRSAAEARAFARRTLGPRHLALPSVLLAVSELATNAVTCTRSGLPGGRFMVSLQAEPGGIRVCVYDGGPLDRPHARREDGEHGRGLLIVDALSEAWGCSPAAGGQCTWCVIGTGAS